MPVKLQTGNWWGCRQAKAGHCGQLEPAMWKPPQGESTVHGILNLGRHEHLLRLGRYNLQHKNKTKRRNVHSRLKYHPKSTQSTLSSYKVLTTGDAIRHPSQSQIGGWVERTWDNNFKILLSIFSKPNETKLEIYLAFIAAKIPEGISASCLDATFA